MSQFGSYNTWANCGSVNRLRLNRIFSELLHSINHSFIHRHLYRHYQDPRHRLL